MSALYALRQKLDHHGSTVVLTGHAARGRTRPPAATRPIASLQHRQRVLQQRVPSAWLPALRMNTNHRKAPRP